MNTGILRFPMTPERRARLQERIACNVEVDPASNCWIWKGRKNKGYGTLTMRLPGYKTPRPIYAHRLSYTVFRRAIPLGKVVAHGHRCISALCCNPTHLRATSHSSNLRDQKRAKTWRERKLTSTLFPPTHNFTHRRTA